LLQRPKYRPRWPSPLHPPPCKMMQEDDPRIKELQQSAWGLQSLTTKPGNRVPEPAKRAAYKVTSMGIDLCSNAVYIEEADWVTRAVEVRKKIEAKRVELDEVEKAEREKLSGKCFRPTGGYGGYTVAKRGGATGPKVVQEDSFETAGEPELKMTQRVGSELGHALTAKEVIAHCGDDPEALWLSDLGLKDSDMDALCEGLRKGGSQLTSIDIAQNVIADAGVQKLVTTLVGGACPKLAELWIGGNCFGTLGEQILTAGLGALRKGLSVHINTGNDDDRPSAHKSQAAANGRAEATQAESGAAAAACIEVPARACGSSATVGRADEDTLKDEAQVSTVQEPTPSPVAAAETAAASGFADVSVEELVAESGGRSLRVHVTVPEGVSSVRELELNVNETRLMVTLSSSGVCLADFVFPRPADPESAQAAFSRKKRTLSVTVNTA